MYVDCHLGNLKINISCRQTFLHWQYLYLKPLFPYFLDVVVTAAPSPPILMLYSAASYRGSIFLQEALLSEVSIQQGRGLMN